MLCGGSSIGRNASPVEKLNLLRFVMQKRYCSEALLHLISVQGPSNCSLQRHTVMPSMCLRRTIDASSASLTEAAKSTPSRFSFDRVHDKVSNKMLSHSSSSPL